MSGMTAEQFKAVSKRVRAASMAEINYAISDIKATIVAQEDLMKHGYATPKLGYYWDELWAYSDELKRRAGR